MSDNANVLHPTNEAMLTIVYAIATHYGIDIADYWAWCKSVVPDTYGLADIVNADKVHPKTPDGYAGMASVIDALMPLGGTSKPATLPAYLYDNGDYENTPTRTVATDNDSRIGTWSDTGTRSESSEAGATITFSAACQSYGFTGRTLQPIQRLRSA